MDWIIYISNDSELRSVLSSNNTQDVETDRKEILPIIYHFVKNPLLSSAQGGSPIQILSFSCSFRQKIG